MLLTSPVTAALSIALNGGLAKMQATRSRDRVTLHFFHAMGKGCASSLHDIAPHIHTRQHHTHNGAPQQPPPPQQHTETETVRDRKREKTRPKERQRNGENETEKTGRERREDERQDKGR